MQEQSKTKQELEDRRSIRKVNLLPVSKVDDQLIKTRKIWNRLNCSGRFDPFQGRT